ncbi:hypothetical protein H4R35_004310 [Dimargaris xerosporica]|nr:hypothetical protein H4R35_004310 [Dimargaris xerosporica]
MSRHRNVRNLDLDEVLEEDQYEDEYDDEEMTEEDFARLQDALQQVLDVVGDNISVTDTEIRDMLWETYYDIPATTNWVLETSAQRKEEQAQRSSVIANALSALKSTPHQRLATRTPAKLPTRSSYSVQAHRPSSALAGLSLAGLAKQSTTQTPVCRSIPMPQLTHFTTGLSRSASSAQPPQLSSATMDNSLVSDPSVFAQFVLRPVEVDYSSLAAGELRFDMAYASLKTHSSADTLNLPDPLQNLAHTLLPWLDMAWLQSNAQQKRPIRPFQFDTPSRDDVVDQAQRTSRWNAD